MNARENHVSTMVPAMISLMDTTAHAPTGIQVISYFYQERHRSKNFYIITRHKSYYREALNNTDLFYSCLAKLGGHLTVKTIHVFAEL